MAKRKALSPSFLKQNSNTIITHLCSLPEIKNAQTIFSYISFGNEVATHEFIKSLVNHKNIVVPYVTNTTKKQLSLSYLSNWSHLLPGNYGILEPYHQHVIPAYPKDIDVCIVPGVAFDVSCHRIGYGYGYFDRILKIFNSLKIGLAFDIQILERLPTTQYDVAMDCIVTEKRIIGSCRNDTVSKTYKSSKYKGQS